MREYRLYYMKNNNTALGQRLRNLEGAVSVVIGAGKDPYTEAA